MPDAIWPGDVPVHAEMTLTADSDVARTPFDDGAVRQVKRYASTLEVRRCSIGPVTAGRLRTLREWLRDNAHQWFAWPDPMDGAVREVRVRGGFGGVAWRQVAQGNVQNQQWLGELEMEGYWTRRLDVYAAAMTIAPPILRKAVLVKPYIAALSIAPPILRKGALTVGSRTVHAPIDAQTLARQASVASVADVFSSDTAYSALAGGASDPPTVGHVAQQSLRWGNQFSGPASNRYVAVRIPVQWPASSGAGWDIEFQEATDTNSYSGALPLHCFHGAPSGAISAWTSIPATTGWKDATVRVGHKAGAPTHLYIILDVSRRPGQTFNWGVRPRAGRPGITIRRRTS